MKKGISLIVLIITIVVIIILATAIIVNIANTDLIGNASEAVVKQDFKTMQDELTMYKADKYVEAMGKYNASTLYADETTNPSIYDVIPSLKNSKYAGNVCIINGELALSENITEEQRNWISEIMNVETYTVSALTSDMKYAVEKGKEILLPDNATYTFTTSNVNISSNGRKIKVLDKATSKDSAVLTGTTDEGTYTIKIYVTPQVENNEYVIYTAEDLQRVGFVINNQIAKTHNMRLENDIDLSTVCSASIGSWDPIGTVNVPYTGSFNGNFYRIRNIYINREESRQALFGYIDSAKISNVHLKSGSITGKNSTSGIVSTSRNSIIENCGNSVDIIENYFISGGICAYLVNTKVYNCYNRGDIVCNGKDVHNQSFCGGISGIISIGEGIEECGVFNSYNTGNITAAGNYDGGIIGGHSFTENTDKYITNCYNVGEINNVYCGALIGSTNSYMNITNSYWTNDIEAYFKHPTYAPTMTNSKQITLDELKEYATTLGDAYTEDSTNINDGLPILKWELK